MVCDKAVTVSGFRMGRFQVDVVISTGTGRRNRFQTGKEADQQRRERNNIRSETEWASWKQVTREEKKDVRGNKSGVACQMTATFHQKVLEMVCLSGFKKTCSARLEISTERVFWKEICSLAAPEAANDTGIVQWQSLEWVSRGHSGTMAREVTHYPPSFLLQFLPRHLPDHRKAGRRHSWN